MCGIAGFIDKAINYDPVQVSQIMGKAIYARGPDSEGSWQDHNLGVNLIHRRLAILDLSAAGHQPMLSNSQRYVMIFNGEIYNFKRIAAQLESKLGQIEWRGHSDSEVILLAIETYGFVATLELLEGMFAIALWDRAEQKLYLARDRIGEKPLYYGYSNGAFLFASELKAIRCHPKFKAEINRDGLGQLMLHNCIPAPLSIYQGISKLMPGQFLVLEYNDFLQATLPVEQTYWQLSQHLNQSFQGTISDSVNELERILTDVIADQMIADVPVGCFLSGGVDSSAIAALMQKQSSSPIKTFSIGFDNPAYNEAEYAKAVARHLDTDHHELYISQKDALAVIPKLGAIYDEPFSDSSQIPTYLVSQLAKTKVTVSLSGDAGDELFAGYNRYLYADNIFAKAAKIPAWAKRAALKLLPFIKTNQLEVLNRWTKLPLSNLADKVYKIEILLSSRSFKEFYIGLTAHWLKHNELVYGDNLRQSLWDKANGELKFEHERVLLMQYLDCLGFLPDDILVKVDRAAMANSLETRVPFLHHKVVEFAFSLPQEYKIRDGIGKWPLRQVLYKHVPVEFIERPKRGFAIPLNDWFRGELKELAFALLDPIKLEAQGFFNSQMVTLKLNRHIAGKENNGFYLWDVLMFQQWYDMNKGL